MSPLILCLTVAGGLLAGIALAQLIRSLPLMLFPELRAASSPVCRGPGRDAGLGQACEACEQGRPVARPEGLSRGIDRAGAGQQRRSWRAFSGRAAPTVAVMILTSVILVWTTSRLGFTWRGAMYATWLSGLLVLAGIDLRHFLLPDVVTLGLLALALLASVAELGDVSWINALCGAILGYAVLWSLNACYRRLRGIDGFGGGDLKMMAALGGWFGVAGVVDVLTLASVLALVFAVIVWGVSTRRVSLQTAIPFGPFLAIAAAGLTVTRLEGGIGSFTALS